MERVSTHIRKSGFTLLEVVVAITIFGLCISLVYLLYNSVTSVAASVEHQAGRDRTAKIIIDRLSGDLAAVYTGKEGDVIGQEPAGFATEDPLLTITPTAHLQLDPKSAPVDVTVVRYYLSEQSESETFSLLRSDTPLIAGIEFSGAAEQTRHLMSDDVVKLEIIYIGQDGEEYSEWNSREDFDEDQEDAERFPQAFTIRLSLGESGDDESASSRYQVRVALPRNLIEFEEEL